MALDKDQIEALYRKYLQNNCTVEEFHILINELGADPSVLQHELITSLFDKTWDEVEVFPDKYQLPEFELPESMGNSTPVISIYSRKKWFIRIAAAAVVLLLLGASTFFWLNTRSINNNIADAGKDSRLKQDIAPGGNKAVLTLDDGSTIVLDSVANGKLTQQGSTQVIKTDNGHLAYNTDNEKPTEILYNTLTTPRGGQYQLQLPDGSKVWLNAASSIRYPTVFNGKDRRVEITGEAYFEVVHDKSNPFHVVVNGADIEDIGTSFNINAYDDEMVLKTTLIEGAVIVKKGDATALLHPGQQAQLTHPGEIKVIESADVDEALAWKNGGFYFNSADIQTIMRQVARWYDVEVVYEGKIPEGHYKGRPSRNLTASQMLKVVEYSGVKFRIEGKKIIVSE